MYIKKGVRVRKERMKIVIRECTMYTVNGKQMAQPCTQYPHTLICNTVHIVRDIYGVSGNLLCTFLIQLVSQWL